jgi:type IV pilus assembly protein PilY1
MVDLKTGDPVLPVGASDWMFDTGTADTFLNSPASLDKDLTNSVDAVYFGDSSGNIYHLSTLDRSTDPDTRTPSLNPTDWTLNKIFAGSRPITAAVSLSVDVFDDVWVYFGTGRYMAEADKANGDQQYMYGLRDPLFNDDEKRPEARPTTLEINHLFEADPYTVYTNMNVDSTGGLTRIHDWYSLLSVVRNTEDQDSYPDYYDGWYRTLDATDPSERVITKPAILGGGVYLPTFVPNEDVCGYGGESYFYALYYETGTSYFKPLLPNGTTDISGEAYKAIKVRVPLGEGMPPPSVGIHAGREEGAKAFLQMSTGEVIEAAIETPFNIKSGLTTWRTE